MRAQWIIVMFGFIQCVVAGWALAANPASAPAAPLEVRTYDVGDLVNPISDYPLPTSADRSGEVFGNQRPNDSPQQTRQEKVDSLLKLIQEIVEPQTWRSAGGTIASIEVSGSSLVVAQTEPNQKAIAALLDDLHRDSPAGAVIEVDAQWLLLTSGQLATLKASAPQHAKSGIAGESPRPISLDAVKDEWVYCRAKMSGFSGQTVSIVSGHTATVVTGANPSVGLGVATYTFSTDREQSGVALQVTPRVGRDRSTIVVDVRSLVSEARPPGAFAGADGSAAPATLPGDVAQAARAAKVFDRPDRVEQNLRTTVRLAAGTPVIIGGMTREPGAPGGRQLYLVLSARAVEPVGKDAK